MDMSLGALWVSMSAAAKGIVIVMIIMSIYSIWVMIERFITFQQAKNQSLKLLGALSNVLTKGDYQQAIDITKKYKQSHLAKVISAGLLEFEAARRDKRYSDPEVAVEAARQGMDRTAMITVAELKENLGVLATIGATAPFVGLFGTVIGIMNSFINIGSAGSSSLGVVAPGIAEALIATALGLFAAIPAVYFYNEITGKVKAFTVAMDDFAMEFLNLAERNFT